MSLNTTIVTTLNRDLPKAAVDTAKYKKALKNKKKLKSLYREKNPDLPLTNERLESFREALEFVVNSNEDPG